MMRTMMVNVALAGLALVSLPVQATLQVLACEPEWAALVRELAGDKVSVGSATTARQDPHHIEARPSLVARARMADLLVCTGAELEVGWLPLLQRESGNARIQPGQPGYFEAAPFSTMIEKPASLDRAHGDVHAAGNPHLHLDPRNIALVAPALSRRLAELDRANTAEYATRLVDFNQRWNANLVRWETAARPLRGQRVAIQHGTFNYLLGWLGVGIAADLEPKPGVEPSAAHLSEVASRLQQSPPRAVIRAAYLSPRAGDWMAQRAKVPAVQLPHTVGGSDRAVDLTGLFDDLIARLADVTR